MILEDLKGKRFNRYLVLEFAGQTKAGNGIWLCRCDCGIEKIVTSGSLKNGGTKSCGCLRRELPKILKTIHGLEKTNFYHKWSGMKQRCNNKNSASYSRYGGRGIKVYRRWLKFINFRDDMYQSYLEHCKEFGEKNTTLDRINNNKGYNKKNCRWVTYKEQSRNRSSNRFLTMWGKRLTLIEWSHILGIHRSVLAMRIKNNWTIEKALSTPLKGGSK